MNPNKASGPDGISHRMLKLITNEIAKPLCYIFNWSMINHVFPSIWKEANVSPIFKKENPSLPENYRPISLLSCVGKIFERVVFKYIYNHLISHNLLYNLQSGFLPNHSTTHQLIEIYHSVLLAMENRQHTVLVFCDFSKAFDRVWHAGLLLKLEK